MSPLPAFVPGDASPLGRARLALEGLSVGDAFGERFFVTRSLVKSFVASRALPKTPWYWTDDTAMGLSIVETLAEHRTIDRDALALRFANRYRSDPQRGYGGGAHDILMAISLGGPWQEIAGGAFGGQGSMGNGGAMRAAPIGGYFADDLDEVVRQAQASAEPTHAHPEGKAGAIAVAVAAALAWQKSEGQTPVTGEDLLREAARRTPEGPTRDGLHQAIALPFSSSTEQAVSALGNGSRVISADTVPFSLWCAARHLDSYEDALWTTVAGLGDRDTTCAIVGGIVSLAVGYDGIPPSFLAAREPLDSKLNHFDRFEGR